MTPSSKKLGIASVAVLMILSMAACSVMPPEGFPRADHVDIEQFMGGWYVIAHIPPEKVENAYNALECYQLVEPGEIATTFTYREGSFSGTRHIMQPTGYVVDGTDNAIWGMQFFWPLQMQYVITYVGHDYQTVIVARSKRDYAWIMARTPQIAHADYAGLVERVAALGYDISQLRKVPQQPLSKRSDGCQQDTAPGPSNLKGASLAEGAQLRDAAAQTMSRT